MTTDEDFASSPITSLVGHHISWSMPKDLSSPKMLVLEFSPNSMACSSIQHPVLNTFEHFCTHQTGCSSSLRNIWPQTHGSGCFASGDRRLASFHTLRHADVNPLFLGTSYKTHTFAPQFHTGYTTASSSNPRLGMSADWDVIWRYMLQCWQQFGLVYTRGST